MDLYSKGLMADTNFVKRCVEIEPMIDLMITKIKSGETFKTFEKQCKKVLKMYSTPCFREPEYKGNYLNKDECSLCVGCTSHVLNRSLDMLKEYPYIPKNSIENPWYDQISMSNSQYIAMHNMIISRYNKLSAKIYGDNYLKIPTI